jgi:hypothetical protein
VRNDGQPLNAPYPIGTTTITWTATDAYGNSSAPATQTITARDAQPSSVTNVSASPSVLRPPNYTYRTVTINYNATDNCSAVKCALSVRTNDSDNHDYQIIDAHHVRLEAELSGRNQVRIYTITITCHDSAGNKTIKTTQVRVPK